MTPRPWVSTPELLALHGVRVCGVVEAEPLACRSALEPTVVHDVLLDAEARGWVSHVEFAGLGGWTMTAPGRAEDDRQLVEELTVAGARPAVEAGHRAFEGINGHLLAACTDWQLRPAGGDPLAENDHTDPQWDARVLAELAALHDPLTALVTTLSDALARFGGYHQWYAAALLRAQAGDGRFVAGIGVQSCHAVWMQLHEDLLSTLGLPRGAAS